MIGCYVSEKDTENNKEIYSLSKKLNQLVQEIEITVSKYNTMNLIFMGDFNKDEKIIEKKF